LKFNTLKLSHNIQTNYQKNDSQVLKGSGVTRMELQLRITNISDDLIQLFLTPLPKESKVITGINDILAKVCLLSENHFYSLSNT
jgi:hypothetical protein